MSVLSRPYFHDEAAAFTFVEAIIWPNGPVCSHCGEALDARSVTAVPGPGASEGDFDRTRLDPVSGPP